MNVAKPVSQADCNKHITELCKNLLKKEVLYPYLMLLVCTFFPFLFVITFFFPFSLFFLLDLLFQMKLVQGGVDIFWNFLKIRVDKYG